MPNQNKIVVIDLNDGNIDKFAQDMPNHGKVFIAYLADWCGHCQHFKPEWEKIKSHLKANPDGSGHVVTVSDKHMQKLPSKQPSGFPTLSLFRGKDHLKDYDGGRNMPEVLQFIKEHLGKQKHRTKRHTKHRTKRHTKHRTKRHTKHRTKRHTKHRVKKRKRNATHKKHKKRVKHTNHKRKRRKLIFDSPATMARTDMFYRGGKRKRSRNKRKRKRQHTKRRRRSRR
jgi:thiol-disulfide isomerase/thioredoxin